MPAQHAATTTSRFRLSAWRVVTWLVLLLAIFGIFQYSTHAWHVAAGLRAAAGTDPHGTLMNMLAWDIAYLVGACISVAAAAGALLRRGWARPVLRVVAGVLALWLLVTVIMLAAHWTSFNHQATMLVAQSGVGDAGRGVLARIRREYLVGMVLKAVGVPVLAWLAWRLGAPAVRAQFRASPARHVR